MERSPAATSCMLRARLRTGKITTRKIDQPTIRVISRMVISVRIAIVLMKLSIVFEIRSVDSPILTAPILLTRPREGVLLSEVNGVSPISSRLCCFFTVKTGAATSRMVTSLTGRKYSVNNTS